MDRSLTQAAANQFQSDLYQAIRTASYNGTVYPNGQKAKEALIRSQNLIRLFHESSKISLNTSLSKKLPLDWKCHPPVGQNSPELKIFGKLKGKDQDIVFLRDAQIPELINDGPNQGETDCVGRGASSTSIVVGVRSQMSSVDKNFDTLMERAFAETLNLRLRMPTLCMGEFYVLPIKELDDQAMLSNEVKFKTRKVNVDKFVKTFNSFSGRPDLEIENQYKYDATGLLFIDFNETQPILIFNENDMSNAGFPDSTCDLFQKIKPENFDLRLIERYNLIHAL